MSAKKRVLHVLVLGLGFAGPITAEELATNVVDQIEADHARNSALTFGIQYSEENVTGTGDAVIPLVNYRDGLLFLNPRVSGDDQDAEEFNLGLGVRQIISEKGVLGANAYWDSRDTASGNHFNQFGFGLEWLTKFWDARFNYYIPESGQELVNRVEAETVSVSTQSSIDIQTAVPNADPFTSGNYIYQDVNITGVETVQTITRTTRQVFEQYEEALEGWDGEIGVFLPLPEKLGQTRAFIGYQSFDNPFGDDLEGVKARLETRLPAGFTFDAEWFEEDVLNGSDYFIGMRWSTDFDLAELFSGRNPMKSKSSSTLDERLTEPVIRDLKVQSSVSDLIENEEKRETMTEVSSVSTFIQRESFLLDLVGKVIVVDSANDSGVENGTFENPYNTLAEAKPLVEGGEGGLFLMGRNTIYTTGPGGIVLPAGGRIYGSRLPFGLRSEGITSLPRGFSFIQGNGDAPAITLGNGSIVGGVYIYNQPSGTPNIIQGPGDFGRVYDISGAGILANNVQSYTLFGIGIQDASYGVIDVYDGNVVGGGQDRQVNMVQLGFPIVREKIVIDSVNPGPLKTSEASFKITLDSALGNIPGLPPTMNGIKIIAENYKSIDIDILGTQINGLGTDTGINIAASAAEDVSVSIVPIGIFSTAISETTTGINLFLKRFDLGGEILTDINILMAVINSAALVQDFVIESDQVSSTFNEVLGPVGSFQTIINSRTF